VIRNGLTVATVGRQVTPVKSHHVTFCPIGQLHGFGRLANAGNALVMLHTVYRAKVR
jgi:hypothetical protein